MPGFKPGTTTLNAKAVYYGGAFSNGKLKLFNSLFYSVYLVFFTTFVFYWLYFISF